MKLKCLSWFIFFLCTTAEGFATLESQDINLSEPVVQVQEIHVLRHAGLNGKVSSESEGDKDEYEKILLPKKAQRGKGAYGGANMAHRPRQAKNAASSLLRPPFFLSITVLSFTVILAFPSLLLKLL